MIDDELHSLAVHVSRNCEWDGHAICAVFLEALTDANFHDLRAKLEETIRKELEIIPLTIVNNVL
jgi:hypothetical protein